MAAENSLSGPAGGTSGGRLCSWPRVLWRVAPQEAAWPTSS